MLANQYGWTPQYVLNELTGKQVRAMVSAIEARYAAEAEAMRSASEGSGNSSAFTDDLRSKIPKHPNMGTPNTPGQQDVNMSFDAFADKPELLSAMFDGFNVHRG